MWQEPNPGNPRNYKRGGVQSFRPTHPAEDPPTQTPSLGQPSYKTFIGAYTAGNMNRLVLRRVYQLRCLQFQCQPASVRAHRCPMCSDVVSDLLAHLRSSCWPYLGFIVSAMAALSWHPSLRVLADVTSTVGEYWVHTPEGAAGVWDPLHRGLARPARVHAVITLSAEQYGQAAVTDAFITAALDVLARPVMTLPYLLERASAVDEAKQRQTRSPQRSPAVRMAERLSVRQSAILGVVLRVLPWWRLAPGPESALPLPPPAGRQAGSERACVLFICFGASAAECLWRASQCTGPPVWIMDPGEAYTLRALWCEDLYVYELTSDATVLCIPLRGWNNGDCRQCSEPPELCML